jgi:SPP1 family predicted phage head-tail adaptor
MISDYFIPGFKIKRLTNTGDGGGSNAQTFSNVATISGRMRPLSGSEMMRNERMNYVTTHRFYCAFTNVISATSRIEDTNGLTYEVKLIINPMNLNEHLQVDCELKQ